MLSAASANSNGATPFADVGYKRASLRAIARTVGVSHGMLRHRSGLKDRSPCRVRRLRLRVLHRLNTFFSTSQVQLMYPRRTQSPSGATRRFSPEGDAALSLTLRNLFAERTDNGAHRAHRDHHDTSVEMTLLPEFRESAKRDISRGQIQQNGTNYVLRSVLTARSISGSADHAQSATTALRFPKSLSVTNRPRQGTEAPSSTSNGRRNTSGARA
jgi:hypothetical protein